MTPTASPIHIEALRLSPADDLRAALQGTRITGALELLTLQGTFSANGVHLHASVARADGTVLGGHLMPGWRFTRAPDAATGFMELVVGRV